MNSQLTKMPAYAEDLSDEEISLITQYCLHLNALGPMDADAYTEHKLALTAPTETDEDPASTSPSGLPEGIAKLFSSRCIRCHGPKKQKSDYRMDSREAAFASGDIASFLEVSAITPGSPDESLLFKMVAATEEDPENEIFPMPPDEDERLSAEELQQIRDWITDGADWNPDHTLDSTYTD